MDILEQIKKSSIMNLVLLNPLVDYFRRCFSKLETITALEYVFSMRKPFSIYTVYIDWDSTSKYQQMKLPRSKSSEHESKGKEFVERYEKLAMELPEIRKVNFNELFPDFLKKDRMAARMVFIGGFNTEFDVLMYASMLFMKGFTPVIVSDLCSSGSERAHFSSLETLSRFAEIIDTRDFQRIDSFGK